MLEKYKDKQYNAYNLFFNSIKNNSISHAYLIDDNGSGDAKDIVNCFIKDILCQKKDCTNCNICSLIDSGNYPEIKVINPDGMFIKKNQLNDLQQQFSRSSVYGNKKFYIINDCDKMRPEAANSLLKFLEEPESSIIAFLITNNFNNILPTIVSRCQIVRLNNNLLVSEKNDMCDVCLNFITHIMNDGLGCIVNEKELWFDKIDQKNRDELVQAVDILITMYYDIMKAKIGNFNGITYNEYLDTYKMIAESYDQESILNKINFLMDAKDSIKYNVNVNLLVDSIIINLGGSNECCRC